MCVAYTYGIGKEDQIADQQMRQYVIISARCRITGPLAYNFDGRTTPDAVATFVRHVDYLIIGQQTCTIGSYAMQLRTQAIFADQRNGRAVDCQEIAGVVAPVVAIAIDERPHPPCRPQFVLGLRELHAFQTNGNAVVNRGLDIGLLVRTLTVNRAAQHFRGNEPIRSALQAKLATIRSGKNR
ncbi:hypothetical protein OSJ57_18600 [Sphingomonas sp. HH69]